MAAIPDTLSKFDFRVLYNFTHSPNTPEQYIVRPFPDQTVLALTFRGCVAAVGAGINYYSRQDVYDRVLLWRVPLIALWSTTTLPAFGLHTKLFTLAHLIADPIDTLWSLIYKLELAKRNTRWATENDNSLSSFVFASQSAPAVSAELDATTARTNLINEMLHEEMSTLTVYFHDIIASIVTAYDEWGYGEQAKKAMNYGFHVRWDGIDRTKLRKRCAESAFYIASDRVSRFLPSTISSLVFLVQIFAGFWKTLDVLGNAYDPSNPVSSGLNRAPHNIAFGTLFFWLPFVVLLTAFIGGSQTSHMIPYVLVKFRDDFEHSRPRLPPSASIDTDTVNIQDSARAGSVAALARDLPEYKAASFPDISSELYNRWSSGGLSVWQVEKYADFAKPSDGKSPSHCKFAWSALALSVLIVSIPTGCAMAVSWLTPTEGFGCRAMTQLSFFLMWVSNVLIDWALASWARTYIPSNKTPQAMEESGTNSRYRKIYWITLGKDLFFMAGTIVTLTWTALGVFNKCECWCKWSGGSGYISFLQDDFVFQLIKHRLGHLFPAIIGSALLSQIVIFLGVWFYFRDGYRVLKQRDIESVLRSRNSWWNRMRRRLRGKKQFKRVRTMDVVSQNVASNEAIPLIRITQESG